MDIDAPEFRQRQDLLRKDLAIGGHDDRLGTDLPQGPDELRVPYALRLDYREPQLLRRTLDRRRGKSPAPACRLVDPRDHAGNLVSGRGQGAERRAPRTAVCPYRRVS